MTTDKTTLTLKPIAEGAKPFELCRELTAVRPDARGAVSAWRLMREEPGAFFERGMGIRSKEDYLAFREILKAHLRFFADSQKQLSKLMRQPGGDDSASWQRSVQASLVTDLIEIRRAGKAWSWQQAEARRAVEAA